MTLSYGLKAGISIDELSEVKQRMTELNEWYGTMSTIRGKKMQSKPMRVMQVDYEDENKPLSENEDLIQYSRQRGQELIETPIRIHEAIEDAMEYVWGLATGQKDRYEGCQI